MSDQETTLDLNRIMEDGMDKFQGELNEAARNETPITPIPDAQAGPQDPESDVPAVTTVPEPTVQPPPADQPQEAKPAEGDSTAGTPGDTPPQEPSFRFPSHEEAERGYRHLQAAKTRAEQEAARLRDELKRTLEAEQIKQTQQKTDQALLDFMAETHEHALEAIEKLNPEDDGYRKAVARIWATKDSAVDAKKREFTAASRQPDTAQPPQAAGVQNPEALWGIVQERAQQAGIDPDDDYFRMISSMAPAADASGPIPFEGQIAWAVQQTLDYHKKQELRFQEKQKTAAAKRAEAHQDANLPLGRTPADRASAPAAPQKVVTLNDALESALEERRL